MAQRLLRTVMRIAISMAALSVLAGCVSSEAPVLGDSLQPFGASARFQLFSLRDGMALDPNTVDLRWNGTRYTVVGGSDVDKNNGLSFHALDGKDLVAQAIDGRPGHNVEYVVLQQVADGVYLINVVDDADADAETRAKFCAAPSGCRVTTPEQVMGLARATAAKHSQRGGLAIRIADDK